MEKLRQQAAERERTRDEDEERMLICNTFIAEKANLLAQYERAVTHLDRTNAQLIQANSTIVIVEKESLKLTKERLQFLDDLQTMQQRRSKRDQPAPSAADDAASQDETDAADELS